MARLSIKDTMRANWMYWRVTRRLSQQERKFVKGLLAEFKRGCPELPVAYLRLLAIKDIVDARAYWQRALSA